MNRGMAVGATVLLLGGGFLSGAARAQAGRSLIGPQLGAFRPTSGEMRTKFGSSWVNLGIGTGAVKMPADRGEIGPDFSVLVSGNSLFGGSQTSNTAIVAPLGLAYRRAAANVLGGNFKAYYGASANWIVTYIRRDADGVSGGVRTTAGGSVFVGTVVGYRGFAEIRQYVTGKVRDYDLSGTNFVIGYRF